MAERSNGAHAVSGNDSTMKDNSDPQTGTQQPGTQEVSKEPNNNNTNSSSNYNAPNENNTDDASAATATTTNQPIAYEGEEKEYNIKFMFRPKDDKQSTEVARYHYAILQTIAKVYPEVKIYDNRGTRLSRKKIESLQSYTAYLRHYDLHYSKGNRNKSRTPIYMVVHRILSRIALSEIRRHFSVDEKLKSSHAKMTRHMWKEDEIRISNLGFFVGYDPSNILPDEMQEMVQKEIARKTGTPEKKIPKFCCNYSSPMIFDSGDPFSTKAFDFQCRQQDAKKLLELLHITYEDNPEFLFHRLRHTPNKEKYINAMIEQNHYLSEIQIVPIAGIHPTIMWTLESKLSSMEGVQRVTKHKDSDRIGRYNVHTTRDYFDSIKSYLRMNIESLVNAEKNSNGLNPVPFDLPPRVAFKRNVYADMDEDEDSSAGSSHGGSFATYITALDKAYGKVNEGSRKQNNYVSPPIATGPTTQAWTSAVPIQTVIMSGKSSDLDSSQVSQEDYDRMKEEKDKLQTRFDELDLRFQNYIRDQKAQQERDKNEMVQTLMAAMQQQMMQSFQQLQMPPPPMPPYAAQGPPSFPQGQPPSSFHSSNQAMYSSIPPQMHGVPPQPNFIPPPHGQYNHNVPNQGMPVQQNFTPQNDGQHYNAPSPASHPQGQYDHPQQNQQQPTATNIATATNQHNKRKPNEMSQDGSVATEHDSKQPATSLDVSMDHGNSSSAADESMTNTSVFSHESRS